MKWQIVCRSHPRSTVKGQNSETFRILGRFRTGLPSSYSTRSLVSYLSFSLPEGFDPCQTSGIIGADGLNTLPLRMRHFRLCQYLNSAELGMLLYVCVARLLKSHELTPTTARDALAVAAHSPHYSGDRGYQ